MTVIAFDGKTVAADRQATVGNRIDHVTKIRRFGSKVLGYNGDADAGVAMVAWYMAGANPEHFPNKGGKANDNTAWLTVFEHGRHVQEYQLQPVPIIIESLPYATGSGCMVARGAMAAGVDARRAVEIASEVCTDCGGGVDALELEPDDVQSR
jgi:hypothetical protein